LLALRRSEWYVTTIHILLIIGLLARVGATQGKVGP
jgi:hypothetical protein